MKLRRTISKYHSWYLCQISLQIMLLPIQIFCPYNSAGGRCLKLAELYLWRIERYIRGKQAWFWQLKLYFNSFLSRKTVAKCLADGVVQLAILGVLILKENQLWFSNCKHFRIYWTKKDFISEWYFTKKHEIGTRAPNKNIVQNHWNIALLNVF